MKFFLPQIFMSLLKLTFKDHIYFLIFILINYYVNIVWSYHILQNNTNILPTSYAHLV